MVDPDVLGDRLLGPEDDPGLIDDSRAPVLELLAAVAYEVERSRKDEGADGRIDGGRTLTALAGGDDLRALVPVPGQRLKRHG
jgi:hypothetical protein